MNMREYTARPDMDGKMKDVDEYIDDMDHLELKKIADESFRMKTAGFFNLRQPEYLRKIKKLKKLQAVLPTH